MRPDLRLPELNVDYRSGQLAWTELHASGLFSCVVYEEVLRFSENGIVARHFSILDDSRAIAREEVAHLRRTAGAGRYSLGDRGYLEFEFSDAKYTGVTCEWPAGLLAFHVYHKETRLSYGRVFRRQPTDLDRLYFEALWQTIDETRGVAELRRYLAGGDVNARHPDNGWSLLHLACEHRNLGLIRVLVEQGANINFRDGFGRSPLFVAVNIDIDSVAQSGGDAEELRFETTRLLLQLGADRELRDDSGRTPRDLAESYGPFALEVYDRLTARPLRGQG
jgi:hypothetical protein